MANEKRLIDANELITEYDRVHIGEPGKARTAKQELLTVTSGCGKQISAPTENEGTVTNDV